MFRNKFDLAGFIFAGVLALAFCSSAGAGVYKCTDSHNRTYYQDRPCLDLTSERLPSGLSSIAGKEEERAFFWKATGEKGVLYLLGSLHFGTQSPYLFPQMVMDAFAASDTVVVEVDLRNNSDKELATELKGRGHYSDKSELESHVKSATWNKTLEAGKKLGINEEVMRSLKPWLAALTLAAESLKQAGYSPEWGVDQTFIKKSEGKKPVLELENVEEQIQLFEGFSDQEQELMLLQTLQELNRGPELYQNIVDAWKHGDAESMDLITRQGFDSGPLSSKLFKAFYDDRNERMANRLNEMAGEGKTFFVVVGAGHIGGERGILKLLQGKGFKIIQP